LITLVALAVTLFAAWVSWRDWRVSSAGHPESRMDVPGVAQYMGLVGLIANLIFALGILWAGLPVILLGLCARTR